MSKTFELTIRDGAKVIHTASANVDDDFERELFDAYLTYYPDATDDGVLFLRIVRGMFEGIMNNIAVAKAQRLQRPGEIPPPRFTIVGEEVLDEPVGMVGMAGTEDQNLPVTHEEESNA